MFNISRFSRIGAFALSISMAMVLVIAAPTAAFPVTLVVDGDAMGSAADCNASDVAYTTIQSAVDAASSGNNIVVCPGTYAENQVLIEKALTVTGVDRDTTIIDGSNATVTEAGTVSINTPVSEIGNVWFSGFTVRNAGVFNGAMVAVFSKPESASSTHTFSNIRIEGENSNDDFGFWTYRPVGTVILRDSIVQDVEGNPVLIEQPLGATSVVSNWIEAGPNGSGAYFSMTYGNDDAPGRQLVKGNTIDVTNGRGAIVFWSAVPFASGTGRYENVDIIDNDITNQGASDRAAIYLRNSASDGVGGEIVAPLILNNSINGDGSATSRGIRLVGYVTDALVRSNWVNNLDISLLGEAEGSWRPIGAEARYNAVLSSTTGLVWDGDDYLDASRNWWGNINGPSGQAYGDGDPIGVQVTWEPWCFNSQCTLFASGGTNGSEELLGTSGNDIIFGFDGADTLRGFAGNDTLYGGAGADMLFGGANNDYLLGGSGPDQLNGGTGNDTCSGGTGNDSLSSC